MLPDFLSAEDLDPVLATLNKTLPPPDAYVNGSAEFRRHHSGNEVGGLIDFPYPGTELSSLAMHPKLVGLAEILLGTTDIRMYNSQAWVKYAGATNYQQEHHRDFPGHTPIVPSADPNFGQVSLIVLLSDVDNGNGPTAFVSKRLTQDIPMFPIAVSREERGYLYESEVPGVGSPGTVIAYGIDTFHRATNLERDGSSRYILMTFFRRADADWVQGPGRGILAETPEWNAIVEQASRRQLDLLGFPPRSHPYWTESTRQGFLGRYPKADTAWLDLS
jgi:hypothetical protein